MIESDDNKNWLSTISKNFFVFTEIIKDVTHLAISEAKLAKQSVGYILLLSIFLLPLLIFFWGSVIFSFFIILQWFSLSWLASFFILSFFNMIVLAGVIYTLFNFKNNFFFNATRRQLKNFISNEKDASC
jgi:uncharacterized membrane protein YqjE